MMPEREGGFNLVLGTQNTGKSTIVKRLTATVERCLIIPANRLDSNWDGIEEINWEQILTQSTGLLPFEISKLNQDKYRADRFRFFHAMGRAMNDFTGHRKIYIQSDDERIVFEAIADKAYGFRKGTLICDDFKNYIPSNNLPSYARNLITDRRHKMLDLWFITHGPRMVPPDFFTYNPGIVLCGTTENFDLAEHKIDPGAFTRLREAKTRVDFRFQEGLRLGSDARYYHEYVKLF